MVATVAIQEMLSAMTVQFRHAQMYPCEGRDPVLNKELGSCLRRSTNGSNLHLTAELDHPVGRQLEEFHRAFRVAEHPGEQFLAPDSHSGPGRSEKGLPRKEEAGIHHLALRAATL